MTVLKNVDTILRDLVSFKSISNQQNLDVIDYLEHLLRPIGFDIVRIMSPDLPKRANLLCKIGPDTDYGLMLSGHLDVVPVLGQNWDSDPFCLTEKENKLIARGAADMKGFIAAACLALSEMKLHGLKKPLTLLWTYDEEVGCLGSAQAAPLLKTYLTHLPSAAIIGEPTNFNILRMHAGHVTVKIHVKGRGAHSSDPDRGISAIKAMHQILHGLFALEEKLKSEISLPEYFERPFVIMNVGEIHGGSAVNIVPDETFINLGFRPLPDTSIDVMFERIVSTCQRSLSIDGASFHASIEKCSPPMITQKNSTLEQALLPFARKTSTCAAQYATDGGNLSQAGIECLVFGPGTIDVAHKANEWIDKGDLKDAAKKLSHIIKQWFLF
jgi:acetylornithine deacetylase